jgi:hypothetical protein
MIILRLIIIWYLFRSFISHFHNLLTSYNSLPTSLYFLNKSNNKLHIGFKSILIIKNFYFFRDSHILYNLIKNLISLLIFVFCFKFSKFWLWNIFCFVKILFVLIQCLKFENLLNLLIFLTSFYWISSIFYFNKSLSIIFWNRNS